MRPLPDIARMIPSWLFVSLGMALVGFARAEEPAKTFAWESQGGAAKVYLVGSIHLLPESAHPLPAVFPSIYEKADQVVFEVPLDEVAKPDAVAEMRRWARYPEGKTLRTELPNDTHKALLKALGKLPGFAGLEENSEQLRAGFLCMALAQDMFAKAGGKPELGVDQHFFRLATKEGKPTSGLETVDFQTRLMSELTREEEEAFVEGTLKAIPTFAEDYRTLVKSWREGDDEKVAKIMNDDLAESKTLREKLLLKRNRSWVPQIEKLLAGDKTVMIIVGAGHLTGEGNLVELLESKGRRFTRVAGSHFTSTR